MPVKRIARAVLFACVAVLGVADSVAAFPTIPFVALGIVLKDVTFLKLVLEIPTVFVDSKVEIARMVLLVVDV